jgi:hypothetical protein
VPFYIGSRAVLSIISYLAMNDAVTSRVPRRLASSKMLTISLDVSLRSKNALGLWIYILAIRTSRVS